MKWLGVLAVLVGLILVGALGLVRVVSEVGELGPVDLENPARRTVGR